MNRYKLEEFDIDTIDEPEPELMELYDEIDHILKTKYEREIEEIIQLGRDSIIFDFGLLSKGAKKELNTNFRELVNKEDSISYLPTKHVNERCMDLGIPPTFDKITLFFSNVTPELEIRELESTYMNGLVQLNGIVTSITEPHSIINVAMYRCKCGANRPFKQYTTERTKPSECFVCGSKRPQWVLIEDKCEWDDYQEVTMQENPETVESGGIPRPLTLKLRGRQLLDITKAGDLIDVIGVLTPEDIKKGKIFAWAINVNHIDVLTKDSFSVILTENDIELIRSVALDDNVMDLLIDSIFPSIHGHTDIKKGLALTLFGGVNRRRKDSTQRGTINMLMVGDPGTAKTRMLIAARNAAPKAVYTSGKGSSAAGLTAAAIQDKMGWRLEAGTLVLADRGIACIDEIEKMRPEDRSSIHDAMALQLIKVDKANIHTTLNARTGVIAAGNPADGRYDRTKLFSENIELTPPILSRFDLIYILEDIPNDEDDLAIADKVLQTEEQSYTGLIDHDLIKKYILYSKRFKPMLTKAAKKTIIDYYIPLRQKSAEYQGTIFISTRQLEGLRRLAEARARMRLSNKATKEDAEVAIELLKSCLADAWYDPVGDMIDPDAMTGKTQTETKMIKIVDSIILNAVGPIQMDAIQERASEYNIPDATLYKILNKLLSTASVFSPVQGIYIHIEHASKYNQSDYQ